MTVFDLVKKRRTIRRFKQNPIDRQLLLDLIEAARLAPSGANLQPLEYLLIDDKSLVSQVFPFTHWAGYLPKETGLPPEGKRPTVYIMVLINRNIRANGGIHDVGAACENIILTALEQNVGCCWLGSIDRNDLRALFAIPEYYEIDSLLALGYPDEEPLCEDEQGSIRYYLDDNNVLHVPKRKRAEIMHHNTFKGKKDE